MEIVYSIFIGIIASMIAGKIAGIGLQCRRDRGWLASSASSIAHRKQVARRAAAAEA
jgi:hypothetical protein